MIQVDATAVMTAGGMVIGAVIWLVRIEGRQNVTDARLSDLKSDIGEIKDDVKALLKTGR